MRLGRLPDGRLQLTERMIRGRREGDNQIRDGSQGALARWVLDVPKKMQIFILSYLLEKALLLQLFGDKP